MSKYSDPEGRRFGVPTYPWGMAPAHLRTTRQLAAEGRRPGGEYEAQVLRARRGRDPLKAHLFDVNEAKPKRVPTAAQREALQIARWTQSANAAERRGVDATDMRELIEAARRDLAARHQNRGAERARPGRERTR
ncbi:RRQRL motif-containing zinc-binding protein [Nocardia sp. NPDC058176]|uniref:RRQRL motif-containing zinc-binding protein n=1 Tax=Nocardia sp. NPDC058176 TaxID=3346368 RepID=UPI0036DE68AD